MSWFTKYGFQQLALASVPPATIVASVASMAGAGKLPTAGIWVATAALSYWMYPKDRDPNSQTLHAIRVFSGVSSLPLIAVCILALLVGMRSKLRPYVAPVTLAASMLAFGGASMGGYFASKANREYEDRVASRDLQYISGGGKIRAPGAPPKRSTPAPSTPAPSPAGSPPAGLV